MVRAHPPSVATRNGMIAGAILGILSLPVITFSAVARLVNHLSGLPLLFLLVALVVFAVAGFSAARRNGLLRSAAWAGFLAGAITAFIGICVGLVILTLMAPYVLVAGPRVAPGLRAGRGLVAALGRAIVLRLIVDGLALLPIGAGAGLLGGLLGRIGRPRNAGGQRAPFIATPAGAQPQVYTPPPPAQPQAYTPTQAQAYTQPPAQPPVGVYTPTPPAYPRATTPPPAYTPTSSAPFYPTATPYDDSSPTTVRDSQA